MVEEIKAEVNCSINCGKQQESGRVEGVDFDPLDSCSGYKTSGSCKSMEQMFSELQITGQIMPGIQICCVSVFSWISWKLEIHFST